jgi:hypothetical protein
MRRDDGLVTNLVGNGVDVMEYVEAELDRRHPVRRLIGSDDVAHAPRVLACCAPTGGGRWRACGSCWASSI